MAVWRFLLAALLLTPCPRCWAEVLESSFHTPEAAAAAPVVGCCHRPPQEAPAEPHPDHDCDCHVKVFLRATDSGVDLVLPLTGLVTDVSGVSVADGNDVEVRFCATGPSSLRVPLAGVPLRI